MYVFVLFSHSMRRRKQREKLAIISKHQDGMSSDDEEPDLDIVKFKETRGSYKIFFKNKISK